jgi:hypothetical protein
MTAEIGEGGWSIFGLVRMSDYRGGGRLRCCGKAEPHPSYCGSADAH